MALPMVDQILERAGSLTPSERLLIASRLIQGVRNEIPAQKSRRKWQSLAGLLAYPALGEDAQTYISRYRQEDDSRRAHVIREGK